jgi:serine/threonine protein kinase
VQGFHDAGYVHGDVKPGNFVLAAPTCFIAASMPAGGLKVIDVGCTQAVVPVAGKCSGRLTRRAGSPMFMAPEVGMCKQCMHAACIPMHAACVGMRLQSSECWLVVGTPREEGSRYQLTGELVSNLD